MRLDKLLSQSANISRQEARKAIWQGRVSVDGQTVLAADKNVSPGCCLTWNGSQINSWTSIHLMLNKPAGVLTAARDQNAPTVMDLLPDNLQRIKCMPVGRLDKDSEGLLLFTTDGELAHRLLSPKRLIEKEYFVRVEGLLSEQTVSAFAKGIALKDFTAAPAKLNILAAGAETSTAKVTITEGKNRQVRRMFASQGHEVMSLKRLRIGPIHLDESLLCGRFRKLTDQELAALKEAVGLV